MPRAHQHWSAQKRASREAAEQEALKAQVEGYVESRRLQGIEEALENPPTQVLYRLDALLWSDPASQAWFQATGVRTPDSQIAPTM